LNGLAGPVAMGGPPVLSALWFPANERTTATALNIVKIKYIINIQHTIIRFSLDSCVKI
jgi:hypothetical protein